MSCRIDKYIWSVRLAKTRSKASELISKGKVTINGVKVKPSREVKIGEVIELHRHSATFEFRVVQLLQNRVGAKLVSEYIEDISRQEEIEKYKLFQASQKSFRAQGDSKPSKKQRRDLDDFLENW